MVNFQNQGQIWNLLVLTFSKHPLHVQFDLAEIFEVKDKWHPGQSRVNVIFISKKSIIKRIKERYHVSVTSNISAKTWSNWICRGCFEIVRTNRFQNWHWFWNLSIFVGVIWQNKIQRTYDHHDCIMKELYREIKKQAYMAYKSRLNIKLKFIE